MAEHQQPNYAGKLAGKRILILGGTSGIGLAVAQASREFGAAVIVSSSNEDKIATAVEKLNNVTCIIAASRTGNADVQGYVCDLFDLKELEANMRALFESSTDRGQQKLDHIVYTAGNKVGSIPLAETDTRTITEHGVLRFYVPIIIGKLASQYMKSSAASSITLTSGVNNVKPVPGRVLMAGWGAGVEGVTRALAVDLRPIRVNCICPGPTRTELFNGFPDDILRPLLEKYKNSTMTRTIANPQDIAEAYLYCMRDTFVDGTVVHSSGGYLLA